MADNRDPKACPRCETVNAWNVSTCRSCGADLTVEVSESEPPEDPTLGDSTPLPARPSSTTLDPLRRLSGSFGRRRWNVFWIVIGIGIYVISVHIVLVAVIKYYLDSDPEIRAWVEKHAESISAAKNPEKSDLMEGASGPLKDKLEAIIPTLQAVVIIVLVLIPIAIGMLTGYFSGTIAEGAASMGLSAVLLLVLNGEALPAVLGGPINASLGAMGAFVGYQLRRRRG